MKAAAVSQRPFPGSLSYIISGVVQHAPIAKIISENNVNNFRTDSVVMFIIIFYR